MTKSSGILLAAAGWILTGCSGPEKQAAAPVAPPDDSAPKITQLYATVPRLPRGETSLLCYGVENARTVWLSPPKHEVSAALARCMEVTPQATTTFTLTAEGEGGKTVTKDVTITVGSGRPKIGNVTVSALEVRSGDLVNICWEAANAQSVTIDPLNYRKAGAAKGCTTDQPKKTTTYVITAAGGDERDVERVTVKVH